MDQLTISMDGFNSEDFLQATGYNGFKDILEGIQQLQANGFHRIKINTVVQTQAHLLSEALDFMSEQTVDIRFIQLMQTQKNTSIFARQQLDIEEMEHQIQKAGWTLVPAHKLQTTAGPARLYQHQGVQNQLGFITPYAPGFCETCNRVRITALGQLHLCLFDDRAYNIRNLPSHELKATWLGHLANKPKHHFLNQGQPGLIHNFSTIGG